VLIEGQRADALGDYLFEGVTLFPGTNRIEFRYHGPNGERSSEMRSYVLSPDAQAAGSFSYQALGGRGAGQESLWMLSQRTQLAENLAFAASALKEGQSQGFVQAQLRGDLRALSWNTAWALNEAGSWASQMQGLLGV